MLTGIHVLLTYQCTGECDHCFLHCGPQREGTFTLRQLRELLHEVKEIGTIKTVYFEGGEPFLFYAVLLEGLRMVRDAGLQAGIVTNGYWSTSHEDAEQWLRPIADLGVANFSVSDDEFHSSKGDKSPGAIAYRAASSLGLPCARICIERPTCAPSDCGRGKGQPVTGGGVLFKGRAAEKLTAGLPVRPWRELTTCPHEELASPERVHVDAFGNVQVCQGRDQSSDRGAAGRGWPCTPRRAFRRGGGRRLCGRVPSLLHGEKIVAAGFPAASRAGSGLRIMRTIMRNTTLLVTLVVCLSLHAQDAKPIQLPAPQMDGGRPLMQVLKERKTQREFSAEKLPMQTMANLLWAADGINCPDGRRTAPSAMNWQEIDIYVAMADGLLVYNAKANRLDPILAQDVRAATGTQAFVATAPVNLVYIADRTKTGQAGSEAEFFAAADAGFISENVYLFCASEGLATVVRGSVDRGPLAKVMKLNPDQKILLAQTVGYPKK